MIERSLVLIKPDGISRSLIGEIISRFEKTGLKIIGVKMVNAGKELLGDHYIVSDKWAKSLFERAKKSAEEKGKKLKYNDYKTLAKVIQKNLVSYLQEGPIVAMVFEGLHAIEIIRKIVGHTEPRQALPGTIRGDFLLDSYEIADQDDRAIKNLIHASSDAEEAKREINLWFKKEELVK